MKFYFCLLAFILSASTNSFGQRICVAVYEFVIPEIAVRAGLNASVLAAFDVQGREAVNIKVCPADSIAKTYFSLFDSCTIKNIKNLTFLSDKNNCRLRVNYISRTSLELSNNFAEMESDSVLNLVYKSTIMIGYKGGPVKPSESDTIIFVNYLPFKTGMSVKSDILAQRIFEGDRDSTIILNNNYPEFEELIIEKSREYSEDLFLNWSPSAKYFFIRFYILRRIDECGFEEIL